MAQKKKTGTTVNLNQETKVAPKKKTAKPPEEKKPKVESYLTATKLNTESRRKLIFQFNQVFNAQMPLETVAPQSLATMQRRLLSVKKKA